MKYVLRFRAKDKKNFLELKAGLKSIETRAATERYRRIQKGDVLVIVCGEIRLEKRVKRVRIFQSVAVMAKHIPWRRINPSATSFAEVKRVYEGYPGYKDKLKKHGVIAFDI